MNRTLFYGVIITFFTALPAFCQDDPANTGPAALYRLTVIERNVGAVNYQYRAAEPTRIDFRGTVLLPAAKGGATVQSRRGRTEIHAKFDKLEPPSKFGPAYLSYVLWAISPEGAPHNLAEIIPDSGNHGRLAVTTELQAFGMIVTAEPYSSVRQPSDVVVLENQARPDTIGSAKPIQAKYELMPRGHFTYEVPQATRSGGPKVSMREYEALLELYQAQNAVGFARAADAEKYARDPLAKAERELQEAQRIQSTKGDSNRVVEHAREAAQTAEDARVIAERRTQADQLAAAQSEVLQARQAKAEAEAVAQQARAEIEAARAQAEANHVTSGAAETVASIVRQQSDRLQASEIRPLPPPPTGPTSSETQRALRNELLQRLNVALPTLDTPRGLVVTLKDVDFTNLTLRPAATERLARVARVVASQPGLHLAVEGHTDIPDTDGKSEERAAAVRSVLVSAGLPGRFISSHGYGNSRPLASSANVSGRIEDRRVEVVISGDPIGTMPFWEQTSRVEPQR